MLVNLQHTDTNCFQILNSVKASSSAGVSVSPADRRVEPIKHRRGRQVLDSPSGDVKKFKRVYKQRTRPFQESSSNPNDFVERSDGIIGNKRALGVKLTPRSGIGVVEKTRARCSTKWLRYGGCIPAILEALERVADLDEALRPWEESLSNKERTIILKEQLSWERALEIFEWFKRRGCYELNVIHYNIMLRILGKAQRWSLVESLWDEMGRRGILPINSTYGTLIDVYSKGGLGDQALRWLELMNKQGMEPDEVTMGIVVQMYKKAGQFEKAEQFFKKWHSGRPSLSEGRTNKATVPATMTINGNSQGPVCLSSYTYNTLIDTFGKAGQLKEASQTFAHMLRDGIVPNTVTFNTMMHVCGNNGQLDEVTKLMKKMEEIHCPPDTRTYNILISLHAKHDDIKMAADYFAKMKEVSIEPDLVSYRTLLYAFSIRRMVSEAESLILEMDERGLQVDEFTQSALTRMYIEADMLDKAWLWFKRFHLEGNMSSECYAANIDAFGVRGHVSKAERAFMSCLEGRKPSVLEFNVMIKAYGLNKKYDRACQLFDSMNKYDVLPDKCSYNSLIQMLANADLPQLAVLYVREMQKAELVTDCIPYCAVISSFVKLGKLEMAEGVYREMVGFDVPPDVVVFGVLINAFAETGSVAEALRYFDKMRESGIPMNPVICNSLIKLYTKVGYLKAAEETYRMLESFETGPNVYSSNCMIDLYSKQSMAKQAEYIFETLRKKGDANEFSYAMMLCMYKRLGRSGEAIQIAKQMRELNLVSDLLSYNHVLDLFASDGRFKEAVEAFKEMINSSVQPDDSTFKSLGVVLMKCGVPHQAIGYLELTRKKNALSGLQAWLSTLSSVVFVDYSETDADALISGIQFL